MSEQEKPSPELKDVILALLKEHLEVTVERPRIKHAAGFFWFGNYEIDVTFMGESVAKATLPDFLERTDQS
jgi:hypothetical protein